LSEQARLEIPVGPQHPALHEPILFRIRVEGERVVDVLPVTGYNHRGAEKVFEANTFVKGAFISARICGICNIVHTTCYCEGLEKLANIEVPPRGRYLRVVVNELERLHSHMIALAILGELIGFHTLFMVMMRDREPVMMLKELVTGNRVVGDYVTPGGVRMDISEEKADKILKALEFLEKRVKYYKSVFEKDPIILKRIAGVGILKRSDVSRFGFVGPTARGSGVKTDVRFEDPYAAYDEIPFNVITMKEEDTWARSMVRIYELFESMNMIRYALKNLPRGEVRVKAIIRRYPAGEAISRIEAQRGELIYHITSREGTKPYRVKIRTPSFNNILQSPLILKDLNIADFPAILASLDPCISCTERAIMIVREGGVCEKVSLIELSRSMRHA